MAWDAPKTNWQTTDGVANTDLNRIEGNTQVLSQQGGAFGTTTGTGAAYSVTASPPLTGLVDGSMVSVIPHVDNTGACTIAVNGLAAKAIKKPNGNDVQAAGLKANAVYTLRYSSAANGGSGAFILQGEGGSGTAQPGDVLSGKTFTNDNGLETGTIPSQAGKTITPGTVSQTAIPANTYATGAVIVAGDADLISANIKAGANVFNVAGKASVVETSDANATAANILSGKTAYVDGAKLSGSASDVLSTVQKQSLVDLTNEAEANDSATKTNFINTVNNADPSIGLPSTATWNDILVQIPNVNAGQKKWKQGLSTSTTTSKQPTGAGGGTITAQNAYPFTISGLDFTPSYIIAFGTYASAYECYAIFINSGGTFPITPLIIYGLSAQGTTQEWSYGLQQDSNYYVSGGTAVLPFIGSNYPVNWIAFE